MKKYNIQKYEAKDFNNWNEFIGQTKNGTFLFHRNFMDYHSDRFKDNSLIVLDGDIWVAVLPANKVGDEIFSHQGLTYGGLVYKEKTKLVSVITIFKSLLFYLNENGIKKIHLNTIPSIYHNKPAEEIQYALFLAEGQLVQRNALAVINLSLSNSLSKNRKRGIQKGIQKGLKIKEEVDFELFWDELLIPNLKTKYNKKPVHSVEEIKQLKSFFPSNIRQFNVYHNDKIIAGTTVFESDNVAHCQYIAMHPEYKNLGCLDFLYDFLISNVFGDKRFFDFGISNEFEGKKLNIGLSYWKESFGAGTVIHDFYAVATANYSKLDNFIV